MRGRAELARAMGRCEAGQRTVAVLPGPELFGALDLLQQAALRLLPLVVRVPLTEGHLPYHAAADTGAVLLMAQDADELPDLRLLAQLLAERALVPVLLAHEGEAGGASAAGTSVATRELLGEAAAMIAPATPAQEMLFGRHRRRVPRWFDLEHPVLRGQNGNPELRSLRRAAWASMFRAPVAELLAAAQQEVESATGRSLAMVSERGVAKARVLVLAQGEAVRIAQDLGKPVGVVGLRCLRPFPATLARLLAGRRPVVVLERAESPLLREVQAALLSLPEKQRPPLHNAIFGPGGSPLQAADLEAFCRETQKGGRPRVYLGVDFAPADSAFPKRQVLMEELRRAYPGLEDLGLRVEPPFVPSPSEVTPAHRRAPPRRDATHDNATRFWDLIGAPVRAGAVDELSPDPYLAARSVPAATSAFTAVPPGADLPDWKPDLCTGCGQCWTACPDSAVLPVALQPKALLETGMRRARAQGEDVDVLQRLVGRLAKGLEAGNAGDSLRQAARPHLAKMADDDRGPAMGAACEAVAKTLDLVALAATEPLGESLLSLVIDPDACKGCGLCVAECEPDALVAEPRSEERARDGRAAVGLWHALPDTPATTIAHVRNQAEPGLAAALSLSRRCLYALAPGDTAEPGSGEKVALRQVLASCEAHLRPLLQGHLDDIAALQERLGQAIRDTLSSALPVGDLDALSEGLATLERGDLELSTLAARLSEVTEGGHVDSTRLTRLVETARVLKDLHWRVREGASGLGRARAGIAMARGAVAEWADAFPWNPFTAPVVVGEDELALGLLEGQLGALCEDFALLRRARALLDGAAPGPRHLAWTDLTEDERRLCPPLWLVGDRSLGRAGAGLAQVSTLLSSGLPVKVLVLVDLDANGDGPDLGLLAIAHRDAFVLQSTVGHRDHLMAGALQALQHEGPALLHVLAPSPQRQGIATDEVFALAREAVARRTFPLFVYDPDVEGRFGLRLSLEGNPATEEGSGEESREATWQTLRELAGLDKPPAEEVQPQDAPAAAAAERTEKTEQAGQGVNLAQLRAEVEHEMVQRLQRKLEALAGGWRP